MKVTDFECYKAYVALKQHFTKESYDYVKYNGKVRVSTSTFYKRKDRLFFEKLSRNKKDSEIIDFFVSNFVSCDDPQSLWIGDIIKNGNANYATWQKKIQSLSYIFEQELTKLSQDGNILEAVQVKGSKHPIILKQYLSGNISIETVIILNSFLGFKKDFDSTLIDPIWKLVSLKIDKYSPFLSINKEKYKAIIRKVLL